MSHAGHKRLLKRIIIGPFRKGSVDSCVVDCRLTMDVFRYRQALPLHPGIEDPQDEVKEAVIAQFALRTSLGHREVWEDKFVELQYGELDRNRRGCRVFCSCAHGSLTSCAACGLYLLNQVSPNTTIA